MDEQYLILTNLVKQMREIAVPAGKNHPSWDAIYEIEAFLAGRPTVLNCTLEVYTKMAKRRLGYL